MFVTMLTCLPIIFMTLTAVTGQRSSLCPEIFSYEATRSKEPGIWYGHINLQTEEQLSGVWVKIKLDSTVDAIVNWFGESTTIDNQEFTIKNPRYKLEPGPPISLRFYVKYNVSQAVPNLISVRLNGRIICSVEKAVTTETPLPFISHSVTQRNGESVGRTEENFNRNNQNSNTESNRNTIDPKLTRPTSESREYFNGDFPLLGSQNTEVSSRPLSRPRPLSVRCGTVKKKPSPLIISGFRTEEGEWPWHIAIYISEGISLNYICGANLITPRYVLTAAHCVTRPGTVKPSNVQGLLLYLGAHNLKNFGPGIQVMQVSDIIVNSEYNSEFFYNDLALLKMSRDAEITDYVRPICLWEGDTSLRNIVGKLGTVVGWGFDENKKITENLMQAKMPVVALHTCIYSNPDFFSRFTSETSFCAGFRNGTGVCNGDSGGGMTFLKNETSGGDAVWHLRGLVSISLPLQGQTVCDPSHYIVFSDVAKHLNWIKEEIKK